MLLSRPFTASASVARLAAGNPNGVKLPSRCTTLIARYGSMSANGANGASATIQTTTATASETSSPAVPTATSSSSYSQSADVGGSSKENFKGDMLEPSPANKQWVRAASVVAAVVLAAGSTAVLPARIGAFMHVTAFGLWLGTIVWNTFFVGLTMFKNMPRQMFGRVQSKLFPQYFTLTSACNFICLGTLLLAQSSFSNAAIGLVVALVASLYNNLVIEPKATKLMFARYDIENKDDKTEEDKAQIAVLYKQFGKWHGISSVINLIVLCCAVAHGWHLASAMTL